MNDVTDATFDQLVMDRSSEVPVVVDLWAPWCGPCKQLGPALEEVIGATNGQVELAKVNVDENPRIAAQFAVQSIPAVYALKDRRVVDGFIGAQPRAIVEEFVARLAPTEADKLVAAGDEASLRRALELDSDHPGAVTALAELLIARGGGEEALDLLKRVPETAAIRHLAARARLTGSGMADGGDGRGLETELDGLLSRLPGDDEARQRIVDLLETMDPADPRVATYRKAMAAKLF